MTSTAIFYIATATTAFFAVLQRQHNFISCDSGIPVVVDGGDYDFRFIYDVTKYLHRKYRYDSFVTFCKNRESNRANFVLVRSLEQALVEDFDAPIIVWGDEGNAKLRDNIGLNNLVFVNIASVADPMLEVVADTMEGLHSISMIFFFKRLNHTAPTSGELETFFEWCQINNILNVALTFQSWNETLDIRDVTYIQDHLFTYTPFPERTIVNITDYDGNTGGGFVLNEIKDVKGFVFETPIYMDPPLVFMTRYEKYTNVDGNEYAVTGSAGLLYVEFVKRINGVLDVFELKDISFNNYRQYLMFMIGQKTVEIGIQPFSGLQPIVSPTESSYPIGQTNACVIVPFVPEIYRPEYLIRSYTTEMWILLLFTLAGICMLQLLISYSRFLSNRLQGQLDTALLYTLRTIVAQPLPENEFQQREHIRYKCLHLFLLGFCMILCSIYSASLTSLLSTTVLGYQIESVNDFLQSGMQILMDDYEKGIYFESGLLPSALTSSLHIVNLSTLNEHRDALNTSFAYVVTAEKWMLLNIRQQRLWKPLFRIASNSLCTAQYFLKYPLQWESPFIYSLTRFSMKVQENGLLNRWKELSFQHAVKMKLVEIIQDEPDHWTPLQLEHLSLAIILYFVLMSFAVIFFMGEVAWPRSKPKKITVHHKTVTVNPGK